MMYVKDRNPDSICETALAFLVMKSPYRLSHCVEDSEAANVCADAVGSVSSILRIGAAKQWVWKGNKMIVEETETSTSHFNKVTSRG